MSHRDRASHNFGHSAGDNPRREETNTGRQIRKAGELSSFASGMKRCNRLNVAILLKDSTFLGLCMPQWGRQKVKTWA